MPLEFGKKMEEPDWANVNYEKPDFQAISYYSAPSGKPKYNSLDEVDPELLATFEKLGISLDEQKKTNGSRHGCGSRFCFCCHNI